MIVWQYFNLSQNSVGGVETHIREISFQLEKCGIQVHISTEPPKMKSSELCVVHTHGQNFFRKELFSRQKNLKLIPILHGTTAGRALACKEYFKLSSYRGALFEWGPTHFGDFAIAVSARAQKEAQKFYGMKLKTKIIPNGANTKTFSPLEKITDKPVFLFLGRADDRVKNASLLFEAFNNANQNNKQIELWAAPGLPNQSASFLKNLGPLFGDDLSKTMKQVKALVLTSLYEGDPVVFHEAKAAGLPVLAVDIPQTREPLKTYKNAFLVKNDLHKLTNKILDLAKENIKPSPTPRDWTIVAKEYMAFYDEIKSEIS